MSEAGFGLVKRFQKSRFLFPVMLLLGVTALDTAPAFAQSIGISQYWHNRDVATMHPSYAAAEAAMLAWDEQTALLRLDQSIEAASSNDELRDLFTVPPELPTMEAWEYFDPFNGTLFTTESALIASIIVNYPSAPECQTTSWAPDPSNNGGNWFATEWFANTPSALGDNSTRQDRGGNITTWVWSNPGFCQEVSGDFPIRRQRNGDCPLYYTGSGVTGNCVNNTEGRLYRRPLPAAECKRGNPCGVSTGAKYIYESDYAGPGIDFKRTYNSLTTFDDSSLLGAGWTYSYSSRLNLVDNSYRVVINDDGSQEILVQIATNEFASDSGSGLLLSWDSVDLEWDLSKPSGDKQVYDSAGVLLYHENAAGQRTTIARDAQGRVDLVTGPFGHELDYTYDVNGMLAAVFDPAGQPIDFQYVTSVSSEKTLLDRVTYQDTTFKQYVYEKTDAPRDALVTGIFDENGDRSATYDYDLNGLVTLSEHGVGKESITLSYTPTTTQVTESGGSTTDYVFESASNKWRKVLTRTEAGGTKTTVYPTGVQDIRGRPTQTTNELGQVTNYTYNDYQTLTRTEAFGAPEQRVTSYEYLSSQDHRPTKIITPSVYGGSNREVITAYNTEGLPTSITINGFNPDGTAINRATSMTYNLVGQVLTVDGPRSGVSDVTTFEYYACSTGNECGQLERISNALSQDTTFDTYDSYGRLTQLTDPNGLVASYTYDLRGRALTISLTPLVGAARVTTNTYNNAGQIETVTTPNGMVLTYAYDEAHDLMSVTDNFGNKIDYVYDNRGNRTDEDTSDPTSTLKRAIDYTYDLKNRIDTINNGGFTTDLVFDVLGNLTDETDPKLASTTHNYDELNRLESTIDALLGQTDYQYDSNDNITFVGAPNGAITTYEYDDLGNLLKEVSPDRGQLSYTYDDAGNRLTALDARGKTTSYQYDELNRLTLTTFDDSSTIQNAYDTGANGIGRLATITDASGSTAWIYNNFGEVTQKVQTIGAVALTTAYGYDPQGRLSTMTYPSGRVVTYGYNSYQQDSLSVDGQTLLSGATYDPFGPVNAWTWGNGSLASRNFDLRGLATTIDFAGATQTLGYDNAGQVTSQLDSNLDVFYDYDLLGRLTDFTNNNGGGGGSASGPMFSSTPVLLANIQTMANETGTPPTGNPTPWMTTAVQNITASGVELALERAEVDTGSIVTAETIGLVAFESASGTFSANGGTVSYEAQTTTDTVKGWSQGCYTTNFLNSYTVAPTIVATVNRHDGLDGGWVRRCTLSNTAVDFTIDEDQFNDSERNHTTEAVGFAAFSQDFDATFTDATGSWQMEAAQFTLAATATDPTFKQVTFRQTYSVPPVVVALATWHGGGADPAAIRIRNVTTTGFEAVQTEPAGENGTTTVAMPMHYIANDPGTHELPDGTRILATTAAVIDQQHTLDVTGPESWYSQTFADWPGSSSSPLPDSQFMTYDANGNRASLTEDTVLYSYSNLAGSNRILSNAGPVAKTYGYDAAGNITSDGIHTYGYDDRGRFVDLDLGAATYEHNGQGQRVQKNNGTVSLFAYDELGNLIGEYDSLGNAVQEHVWFNAAPVAVFQGTSEYYVHTDHLGTPRAITDGNTVIWRWQSDPFGSTAAQEDPDGNSTLFTYNLRFPGQYYDVETGLHYNYFRTYDPSTGRYLESDPIGLGGGPNTYSYVLNSPTNLVDPKGLYAQCIVWPVGTAACAGTAAVAGYRAYRAYRAVQAALAVDAAIAGAIESTQQNDQAIPFPFPTTRTNDGETCDEDLDEFCRQERAACAEMCADAAYDPDRPKVFGGSIAQCIKNCLPAKCGGEPLWKGFK